MNLEDFKSFCRVLRPSEVGSIPTHSRQILWLFGVALLAGPLGPGPAQAQGGAREIPAAAPDGAGEAVPSPPSPAVMGPSALERAIRSALFPAWGQITNGKEKKGVVLFAVETYFWTRIVSESRHGGAAKRRAERLRALDPFDPAVARAQVSAEQHFERRRNLLFWAILAAFYGALDAYVDAHLGDFDKELEEGRGLFADAQGVRFGLAVGF